MNRVPCVWLQHCIRQSGQIWGYNGTTDWPVCVQIRNCTFLPPLETMEQQKQLVCRGDEAWHPSGSANCPSTSGPAGPELFAGESREAQTVVSNAVVCFCPYTICHYSSAWASCFSPQCVVCCAFQRFSMCWFWKWQQMLIGLGVKSCLTTL